MKAKQTQDELEKIKKEAEYEARRNRKFHIGLFFVMCVIGPYLYYAVKTNIWGLANKPEGFRFPHITDYWRIVVGMVVWVTAR